MSTKEVEKKGDESNVVLLPSDQFIFVFIFFLPNFVLFDEWLSFVLLSCFSD